MSFNVVYVVNGRMDFRYAGEYALPIDVQGIDAKAIEDRGEYLPTKSVDSNLVIKPLIESVKLRNSSNNSLNLELDDLSKYKDFDFIVKSTLDADLRIAFGYSGDSTLPEIGKGGIGIYLEDGSSKIYGVASSQAYHLIPESSGNMSLSSVPVSGDVKPVIFSPFKKLSPVGTIQLRYRAESIPSSGGLSITFVGVPN